MPKVRARVSSAVILAAVLALPLAACDQHPSAERAGKTIDQQADAASRKLESSADKLRDQTSVASSQAKEVLGDASITTKVKAAIFAEPGLRSLQVNVDTKEGVVTLSGSVDSPSLKDRAQQLASAVEGVKSVDNRLVAKSTTGS
jgi:hyperosmotically inducible protein